MIQSALVRLLCGGTTAGPLHGPELLFLLRVGLLLQRGQNPREGDDDGEEGLPHAEHQRLQRNHPLPRHAVNARHRRACR